VADDVIRAAARHRNALAANRKKATQRLAAAYATVTDSVLADWRLLSARIQDAVDNGEEVSAAWLARQAQYETMLARLGHALTTLAPAVASIAAAEATTAISDAIGDTSELLNAVGVDFPQQAARYISGATKTGPVAQLITARAGEFRDDAARIIQESVIRGQSPHVTARKLRRVTGNAFINATTVVRTEQMRAYREASRQTMQANPAVDKWRWLSRRSERTCAYCWAMDGTEFPVHYVMPTHPNCGCTMMPVVPDVEYGPNGADLFAAKPDAFKRSVLGPAAHLAYTNGEISLNDLILRYRSPKWGPSGRVKPLSNVLGHDRVQELIREAVN
jgi:SPP1 gp7 family putative phage head morphogenesis protein